MILVRAEVVKNINTVTVNNSCILKLLILIFLYPPWGDPMQKEKCHKEQVLHRIKIIEGHLKAIEKMIVDDVYCVDIMNQSLAVQKALKNLDMCIMENHLNTCVIEQVKTGEQEKMVRDLLNLYKYK